MEPLNFIINWCNSNQGFIMVVLTAIYVVATIFIYGANNKSAKATKKTLKQNSEIQKQNVDIQLFNDRFHLYSNIKSILEDKYNEISKPFDILNNVTSKVNYNKDVEINILKVKYLFTNECYEQLSKVVEIINEISSGCYDINYIYELIEREVDDSDFITEIQSFVAGYEQDQITVPQEEKFKKLCDDRELYVAIIPEEYKHYNYYEMYKNIGNLERKLGEEKCILLKLFESELDMRGIING